MLDVYEMIDECRENGMTGLEALQEVSRAIEENRQAFFENYYNSQEVQAGWAQQDLIDTYRRER